jgi:microcystin-dependent protein
MTCSGQVLNISENTALFSLIGTTFGGDGRSTFGLPDLATKSPFAGIDGPVGYCICVNGTYPQRV